MFLENVQKLNNSYNKQTEKNTSKEVKFKLIKLN